MLLRLSAPKSPPRWAGGGAQAAARARHRQPEGRRRQDHDRDQSRHRARRHRRAGADRRSRSAGQRLDRARHRPPQPPRTRPTTCSSAKRACATRSCATAVPRLLIAPSTLDLSGLELEIGQARDRAFRLRNALAPLNAGRPEAVDFTYVLVDCPPSLNLLTVNAMAAAQRDPGAAAMRVLRARRPVAAAQDGRAGQGDAQSRPHHPRHRAHHVRRAQQSLQPGGRRRARVHGPRRSTTPSSRAMCGCRKRRPTASRCWSTISNASAAKPICGSRPRSSSARRSCARAGQRRRQLELD